MESKAGYFANVKLFLRLCAMRMAPYEAKDRRQDSLLSPGFRANVMRTALEQ